MIKILKDPGGVTSLSGDEIEHLKPLAESLEEDRLIAFVEHLNRVEEELRRSTYPRYLLEVAMIKMARIQPLQEFRRILSELESLEQKLSQTGDPAGKDRLSVPVERRKAGSTNHSTSTENSTVNWESMVKRAHEISPPEGSVLEQGFLEVMEGKHFVIGFKNRLHYDRAEKKKEKILQIFKDLLHRDLSLEFSLHEKSETSPLTLTEKKKDEQVKKREKVHRESLQHHVVQEAVKIFHGRVMEVREYQ